MIYEITGFSRLGWKEISFLVEASSGKEARKKVFSNKTGRYLKRETVHTHKVGKVLCTDEYYGNGDPMIYDKVYYK